MFRTIAVGYDGPDGGGEAIAPAELLREPRISVDPQVPPSIEGYAIPEVPA